MRAFFARAGVDYEQWKAITRTLLRSDFRPPGPAAESYSLRSIGGFLLMVVTYGLFGLGAAFLIAINDDVLLTGVVTLSYLAMLLSTALLAQHSATIASTTDYAILAPRPVSSHTFLAVRMTNVLFHALLLTTLMAYPPVIAYTVAHGVSLTRGFASALAIYGFALAITFALVALYGTLLRVVGAARINKVVSYTQMIVGILAYGGVVLVIQIAGSRLVAAAAMPREPWLLLVPPAWFASYLEIAVGEADWNVWSRAGVSLAALVGCVLALRGPLGMSYAERLGELSTVATPAAPPARDDMSGRLFAGGETRAVSLLVRAHFRHDLRVRMGVLAIVPLTFLYMAIGVRNDAPADPFLSESGRTGVDLVAMAVLFFPTIIVQHFSMSDAYRAAWVYFATPADRAALVLALKRVIVARFYAPYIVLLAAIFWWRFGHLGHAVVHAGFLGAIGYLALQIGTLLEPRLPFALPQKKAANSASMFAWMTIAILGGNFMVWLLVDWAYGDWWLVALFAFALVVLNAAIDRLIRARSSRRYESFEFS